MNKCIYGIYLDNLAQIWLAHIHHISKVSWNHVSKNVLYVSSHNNMDKVSFLSCFIFFYYLGGKIFLNTWKTTALLRNVKSHKK